jgi:hypothetical protein
MLLTWSEYCWLWASHVHAICNVTCHTPNSPVWCLQGALGMLLMCSHTTSSASDYKTQQLCHPSCESHPFTWPISLTTWKGNDNSPGHGHNWGGDSLPKMWFPVVTLNLRYQLRSWAQKTLLGAHGVPPLNQVSSTGENEEMVQYRKNLWLDVVFKFCLWRSLTNVKKKKLPIVMLWIEQTDETFSFTVCENMYHHFTGSQVDSVGWFYIVINFVLSWFYCVQNSL